MCTGCRDWAAPFGSGKGPCTAHGPTIRMKNNYKPLPSPQKDHTQRTWWRKAMVVVLLGRRVCQPVLRLCSRPPSSDFLRHLRFGGSSKQAKHCLTCLLCRFPPGVPPPRALLSGALRSTRRVLRCSAIHRALVHGLLAPLFPSWRSRWHPEASGP